ncbi:RNA polymerase factor sigma-54 [Sideroxydans lithotrophicus]|uniref:RNA polymerase sigma-54 factor n=1 Tax=Sideroxydans lithotrophicus (strain ES-1) TaxID=580332 RepID=D5CM63_SIDLE|nr:RNA polymerase factor sigma-54 [Sideroxydans lithotrophicus]ADE10677.1 RNA polymerase, sigma 54 subunit, RpoN [Sideroxydans lithotrophicus ES-1]
MKHSLQLRQSQQLMLTPQLQQAIKLLQLSTLEINQETARLLDENPFLEREDDNTNQTYSGNSSTDTPAPSSSAESSEPAEAESRNDSNEWPEPSFSSTSASSPDDEDDGYSEVAAEKPSMREHLLWELNMSQMDPRDKKIVGLLIDALDENAYLSQPLEEIVELLPPELDITLDDLETALVQLQHLDAPGIGARNLSECLALQLRDMPEDVPGRDLALTIVSQYLDLLAARDFSKLKKTLRCDDDALRCAQDLIVHLQPKPGSAFEHRAADYVVPDVLVERHGGIWRARLNPEAMPRLRINQVYANILQQRNEKNAQEMAGQLQEARWFIKNLQQRFETILRVSQAIVERQRQFFEHGDIAMRPLVLREIAEQLELHESTISRVTTQKFMLTPRGIYEFKYFFGSGLATEAGGACSSTAIRALIKQLVSEEDAKHPLTDSRMSEILAQQGILVARRTVAKYREGMNILPVNLRKSL